MKVRLLLAALALAGGAVFTVACSEDGSLSLDEYFGRVEELRQAEEDRFTEIRQELDAKGQDATPAENADAFEKVLGSFDEFVEGLGDIDPPSAVQDTHNEAVEALGATREDFEGVLEDLRGAESLEDVDAIFESAGPSFDRADQVCRDLQQIAEDSNIDVDLKCQEE